VTGSHYEQWSRPGLSTLRGKLLASSTDRVISNAHMLICGPDGNFKNSFSCQFENNGLYLFLFGGETRLNRRDRVGPRGWEARKQMAPQVLEKARFAEENGSRHEVNTDVRIFFELRKNEVKRLKSLSRAQNRTLALTVNRYRVRTSLPRRCQRIWFRPSKAWGNSTETPE
jgi:hypothetical protein